ncbi:MAG: lipoyl synthase [Nitrospiraceae bacterium]|nr:lipoyl synthase [Nitrospiraceae bacterium]
MRLPKWIKSSCSARISTQRPMKSLLKQYGVKTVCEEARCPNKSECFSQPSAAFMILGSSCTRNCGFCSVEHSVPVLPDPEEPGRIAAAVQGMGLHYAVITSVTRDDLDDGGASQFALTIAALKSLCPDVRIEVLIPDFRGNADALKCVIDAGPDVLNHNIETVSRLYSNVRPQAVYSRSIGLLNAARHMAPDIRTKSGFMLGLGETQDEVMELMSDLRAAGCSLLTIGQYMRPAKKNIPVVEYIKPEVFEAYGELALEMGFEYAASGPMVRSSMNAHEAFYNVRNRDLV